MHLVRTIKTCLNRRWLIYVLVMHNLKLRYRGSAIGFLWTLLNPLLFMGIYTLVFSKFFRFDIPKYPVFLLSGLIAWTWFTEAVNVGVNSVVGNAGFIKSSIFPSEILPAVSVATAMMNFVFALPLLFLFLAIYHIDMGYVLLSLPLIMAVHFILTLGIVSIVATLNVFFRDIQYLINHILLALFFLTPVFYELRIIPERFHTIMKLNPLSTLINSYRSVLFYNQFPDWQNLGYLLLIALAFLWVGSWVFESQKEVFAEYV